MFSNTEAPEAPKRQTDDQQWWRLALLVWIAVGLAVWLSSGCAKKTDPPSAASANRTQPPAMHVTPRASTMRAGTTGAMTRPGPARRAAAPTRRRASTSRAAALSPLPKDVDLGPEVKRLFDTLFCVGRSPDGPCQKMVQTIELYRRQYLQPMRTWLATRRPKDLPPTLLYPFAGGDLVSAISAFPDQRRYVHLSLEHAGPPDPLRGRTPAQILQAHWKLYWMAGLLLTNGESFSVDLQKQEAARLPGVLPLFLVGLRVHGGHPTGLSYLRVTPDGKLQRWTRKELSAAAPKAKRRFTTWKDPRYSARFSHMELRFRLPGDTADRRVIHISANLANVGLRRVPGLVRYLEALKPVALMIKASSYLMWTEDFSRIRDLIFAHARFALSDFTAPYPAWLKQHGFSIETHGRYACMKKAKLRLAAVPWIQLFNKPTSRNLPFRWGYVDCRSQNHIVILRKVRRSRRFPGAVRH